MSRSIRVFIIMDGLTHAQHMIIRTGEKLVDKRGSRSGVIRVVSVNHQVDVSLDVGEGTPHDIALALEVLPTDVRACLFCNLRSPVSARIIKDVNGRVGERVAQAGDHVTYGLLFVMARHDYGHVKTRRKQMRHNSPHVIYSLKVDTYAERSTSTPKERQPVEE